MRSHKGKKECSLNVTYMTKRFCITFDQGYECCPAEPDVGISQPYIELDEPENLTVELEDHPEVQIAAGLHSTLLKHFYEFYESRSGRGEVEDQIASSFAGCEEMEED